MERIRISFDRIEKLGSTPLFYVFENMCLELIWHQENVFTACRIKIWKQILWLLSITNNNL